MTKSKSNWFSILITVRFQLKPSHFRSNFPFLSKIWLNLSYFQLKMLIKRFKMVKNLNFLTFCDLFWLVWLNPDPIQSISLRQFKIWPWIWIKHPIKYNSITIFLKLNPSRFSRLSLGHMGQIESAKIGHFWQGQN